MENKERNGNASTYLTRDWYDYRPLRNGKSLPEYYKAILYDTKKEYELIFAYKEREENILADTMVVPLQVNYRVELTTTPCNFAGKRYWFVCPLVVNGKRCRRRVGKLYLPPGEIYFGCRNCYNLTYRSCKEHDKRVGALIETPDALLALMRGNDPEGFLNDLKGLRLAVKAYTKLRGKWPV